MKLPNEFYTIISGTWPMLVIFMVVISTIRISYILEKKEKFLLYKEFFSLAFMIYILLLFGLVTNTDVQGVSNNFVPFREILRYKIGSKYFLWNVLGNILIFVPFGFLLGLYLKSKKATKPVIITLVTSITIECVQMFIGRSFDVDDIILNCIGGFIGSLIFISVNTFKNHLPKILRNELVYNILTVIVMLIIIYYVFVFKGGIIK